MSNNLGQIYATSKHAEKYIILDSQNVEVSGNFYINGTNSRLPAELENSIRNYLPLTYGTTDPNPNTLYDVISEVSNNLLISNNDASFGNVDISGNLTLKGSLGVLDNSTNDISYGAVGSILTSNGSGSVPTWVEPVAFKATNDENTDITGNTGIHLISNELTNVSGGSRSAFQVGTSYNTSTGYFTAPYDGLYYFHASVLWKTSAYAGSYSGLYIGLSTLTAGDQALVINQVGANEAFNANFTQNCDGVVKLDKGQQVGIFVNAGNSVDWKITRKFCVFGGYLIQRL